MEVLKKNLTSIVLGVVVILAVAAIFWPISGMYTDLQKKLALRLAVQTSMDNLLKAQRHLPLVSPDQTDPGVLAVFPSQAVIDAGKAATDEVATQAEAMMQKAVEYNRHILIFPNALPKPDDATKYSFAQKYIEETTNYARWQQILNSGPAPTADEINKAVQDLKDRIYKKWGLQPNGSGDPAAVRQAADDLNAEVVKIKPALLMAAARKYSIYMQLPTQGQIGVLPYDTTVSIAAGHAPPRPEQIWADQLGIWILDDITHAIARTNRLWSDSDSPGGPPVCDILHAPIKQLERVDNLLAVTSPKADDSLAGVGGPTPKVPSVSPTGRVCNALYDVERFRVALVVDATKIPIILRELQSQQFLSILNVQINEVVDPAIAAANGYRYEDKPVPVVRMELDCEDLLMRNWTSDLMPDSIKSGTVKSAAPGAGNAPSGEENN